MVRAMSGDMHAHMLWNDDATQAELKLHLKGWHQRPASEIDPMNQLKDIKQLHRKIHSGSYA